MMGNDDLRKLCLTDEELIALGISPDTKKDSITIQKKSKKNENCTFNKLKLNCAKSESSQSDSDEDGDVMKFFQLPRGVHNEKSIRKPLGRGTPFYPNLKTDSDDIPLYDYFNRMEQELNPLIQMTDNELLKNSNIEKLFSSNYITNENKANGDLSHYDGIEDEDDYEHVQKINRELECLSKNKKNEPKSETITTECSPTKMYNERKTTRNSGDISTDSYAKKCDTTMTPVKTETTKRNIYEKTNLYIPPHRRPAFEEKKTMHTRGPPSSQLCIKTNVSTKMNTKFNGSGSPNSDTTDVKRPPVQKTRTNVLLAGLLKKESKCKLQTKSSPIQKSSTLQSSPSTTSISTRSNSSSQEVIHQAQHIESDFLSSDDALATDSIHSEVSTFFPTTSPSSKELTDSSMISPSNYYSCSDSPGRNRRSSSSKLKTKPISKRLTLENITHFIDFEPDESCHIKPPESYTNSPASIGHQNSSFQSDYEYALQLQQELDREFALNSNHRQIHSSSK